MTDRWIMAGAHAKVERLLRPRLTAALVAGALALLTLIWLVATLRLWLARP